jgi:4-amino-4-deoxy-L-arabinose transferase-like glycosyltransferase
MSDPSTATDRPAAAGRWHGLNPASNLLIVFLAVAGVIIRWIVLAGADGRLGADESYAGLQAYGILDGDLPVVIRGAVYTAVLESYVFAPLTPLVGGHIVALKALFILIWAVASVLVGVLAGRLLGRTAAVVAGALVWLSPGALLAVSTLAYPGYALGMAATVVAALLAVDLADDAPRRGIAAAFGFAAGLGFWIHPMFVAVTAPVVVFVFAIHRRRITEVWLPAIVGAIVGSLPLILWNAVNGWPSLTDQPDTPGTYTERFRAIVSDLFPRAFGLKDAQLDWRFGTAIGPVLYVAVIALVAFGAIVLWRREGRRNKLVPITLAVMVPLMAALPPLIFADDGRYAVIAFPFIVVAVTAVFDELLDSRVALSRVVGPAAVVVAWLALLVGPAVVDAARTVDENPNATVEMVRDRLATAGVDTVNGSFWEVLPIDYVADDDLTAAVLPYYSIRFPDQQRAVEASDPARVAFVFALFDERPDQLWMAPDRYTREQIGEAVLYLPITLPTDGDG